MKFSSLTLLLLLISCGKTDVGTVKSDSVGELRSLVTAPISSADQARIQTICNALTQKEIMLDSALNSPIVFATSQSDCSGNLSASGDVSTVVQKSGAEYFFKTSGGLDFIFPQVETTKSGILAQFCSNLPGVISPILTNTEATFISTSGIKSSDCQSSDGEVCVLVEKAFIEGDQARVHTKDWMRVRVSSSQGKVGFFTHRRKVSKSYCGDNEVVVLTATLK